MLAQNGGTGWDLLTKLVVFEPGKRLSAAAALRHPWFGAGLLGSVAQALDRVGSSMGDVSDAECSRAAFPGCQQSFEHFSWSALPLLNDLLTSTTARCNGILSPDLETGPWQQLPEANAYTVNGSCCMRARDSTQFARL